jgi:hypothetical protein
MMMFSKEMELLFLVVCGVSILATAIGICSFDYVSCMRSQATTRGVRMQPARSNTTIRGVVAVQVE